MKRWWLGSLGVAVGLWAQSAWADEVTWRPVQASNATVAQVPASADVRPPLASLGRPVVPAASVATTSAIADANVTPAAFSPAPQVSLGPVVRMQAADPPPPGVAPVQPVPPPGVDILTPSAPADPAGCAGLCCGGWTNWLGSLQGCGRNLSQSDHCFDGFISPVSNPFLFEDPRALTEVRPIFIWQGAPDKTPFYHGSDIEWFGLQARVAITERISLTMTKLGFISQEIHQPGGPFENGTSFSQVDLGVKYTFLRNECTGTLGAAGLNFEIPAGSSKVFQDTGVLSLRPYVTLGQNFGRTSWGSFNVLGTAGGSFSVNDERSSFVFTGLHLDFDVANMHKIYPLVELNWLHYTRGGNGPKIGFEGADLINFGASGGVSGDNLLTIATGARYKICEWAQIGAAIEWPLTGNKFLEDFRLTVDMIFRY
jgi:hypothetical protein